jgi:voltage-gated potassium channel Kch
VFRGLWRTIRELWQEQAGRLLLVGVIIVASTGTVFYHFVEGWSLIDSLYFTVITLTTIGYGDLHPTTDLSKLFTIAFVLSGVSFILGFLNFVVQRTAKRVGSRFDVGQKSEGAKPDGLDG